MSSETLMGQMTGCAPRYQTTGESRRTVFLKEKPRAGMFTSWRTETSRWDQKKLGQ